MEERVCVIEETLKELKKELKFMRNMLYYFAGIMTVNVGFQIW